MADLHARAESLPQEPGVYLFKDARGRVLYVGKAKNLRARVKQYVLGHDERVMVPFLVRAAHDVEITVVRTEKEALLLENSLIKKHRPRYNTQLVDDTNFLHLRLDPSEPWPRYRLTRGVNDGRARYFGPYTSAQRARATLEFLGRRFPLRTCSDEELARRKRPCLLYEMHRCLAPCVNLCTREQYEGVIQQSVLFLEGKNQELLDRLRREMFSAAEAEHFEEAARLRDLVRAIEATVERQQVVDTKQIDRDVWGLYREGERGAVALLPVREGALQEAITLPFQGVLEEDGDLLSSVLNHWYQESTPLPPEVLVPVEIPDAAALVEVLTERRGLPRGALQLRTPQRGDKKSLVELALSNAKYAFSQRQAETDRAALALAELQKVCHLPRPPRRIECFDNSNIQGTDPVASMVVFTDGKPDRAAWRRYKVKTVEGADDFATMREILGRRFRRALREGVFPDLLVVDGGKGQLSSALAVMEELGVTGVPVIGFAKPMTERRRGDEQTPDKIVLPGVKNPIVLRHNSPALLLLQALRDETHKAAVSFHRKVRTRRNLKSRLESLPGVGPAKSRALLAHFGSAAALGRATPEQIALVPGFSLALATRVAAALATRAPAVEPADEPDQP